MIFKTCPFLKTELYFEVKFKLLKEIRLAFFYSKFCLLMIRSRTVICVLHQCHVSKLNTYLLMCHLYSNKNSSSYPKIIEFHYYLRTSQDFFLKNTSCYTQQGQQDFNKKLKPIHGTLVGSKSYVRRSRSCVLGNPSKWGWPEKNKKLESDSLIHVF